MSNLNKHNQKLKNFLTDKLNEHTNPNQAQVLEIGIGEGRVGRLIADKVNEYKGIDLNKENVEAARENAPQDLEVEYKQGNAVELPFDEKFDAILYINSWHYIKNHEQAIAEAERLLKEDGVVIILEPTKYTTNWKAPQLKESSDQFDREIYEQKMKNIRDSEENLREQNIFEIKEEGLIDERNNIFYILKIFT